MQPYSNRPGPLVTQLDIDRRAISIETRRAALSPLLPIDFPDEASADGDLCAHGLVPRGEAIEDFLVLGWTGRELFIVHAFYCER